MLPTYLYGMGTPLVPLDLPFRLPIDIGMTYLENASQIPRVRALTDWLIEIFSPKVYPWFRDEFIRPQELKRMYRGKPLINPLDIGLGKAPAASVLRRKP